MCRGAGLLPSFKRLLLLSRPAASVSPKAVASGLDLPEDQQAFFFQRGDLLFQRIAALIICERHEAYCSIAGCSQAPRSGTRLTRLEPVTVAFQVFNRFFPVGRAPSGAEIVLIVFIILFQAQRQGSVKFYTCSACACWALSAIWRRRLRSS